MEDILEWQKITRESCEEFVDQATSSPGSFDKPTPRLSREAKSSTPTLVPEGDGKPSEVVNSSPQSEGDDHDSEDSEAESDDVHSSSIVNYQDGKLWNKFVQKYSKSHMQSMILQEWQVFDKEYARRMAKDALRFLKSGMKKGGWITSRREGGTWVDRKNAETWDTSMMGTKFIWPGDLPKLRLENIRREFISWMNIFDWEIESFTFSVTDDGNTLGWVWKIKVPEYWQNSH